MIIGIDGNEANIKDRVGVNTYAYEILKNIQKLQGTAGKKHVFIVYLKSQPLDDMPEETANFKYKVISGRGLWIITKLIPYLLTNTDKVDIFFSPSHYVPVFTTIPKVCSIMDLGYLDFSEQFTKKVFWQLRLWTAISIFVSKGVIAISKSTMKDIVRHYPSAVGKVEVAYLGYDEERFNVKVSDLDVRRIKSKYSIVDDYVLYLGTLKPSKNIDGLVSAFANIADGLGNTKLVIAGKKGWLYKNIFDKVDELGMKDKIIFTDFVSEEDKPALIRGSKVFVLPSFWEGFGLDVLSAMACGVPVVASNVGSLPEVVGSAGELVDPYSIDSIANGVKKVLSMTKNDYNRLVLKGLEQVKKFSWAGTAQETIRILENVYHRKVAKRFVK